MRKMEVGIRGIESFGPKFAADLETQKGFKGRASRIVIQCQKVAVFISTHLDHRVDGELNGVTESVQGHRCRIDQESHVVDYRFDNGKRARVHALALGWVMSAQQELPGSSLFGEIKVRERARIKRLKVGSHKIIGRNPMKIGFKKRLCEA